ncbi:hypothetical protein R3I94_018212 [Phoxinus phoxinus]
MPGAL